MPEQKKFGKETLRVRDARNCGDYHEDFAEASRDATGEDDRFA